MPEDLLGSRELRASSTSSSDMSIEIRCCLTEMSTMTSLFVDTKLLVENTEKKNLLNNVALSTSSVALASRKCTVFGIEVDFLMFLIYLYILDWFLRANYIDS